MQSELSADWQVLAAWGPATTTEISAPAFLADPAKELVGRGLTWGFPAPPRTRASIRFQSVLVSLRKG